MTTVDQAASRLANLVMAAQEQDGPPAQQLGKVTAINPLMVAFDSAQNRITGVGPIALGAGATVAVNDQVLVLYLPGSGTYLCIGKVSAG